MPGVERETSAETAAAALRATILEGDIPPGAHLREEELAAAHRVGRHTLRAAFALLAREGLVVRERNRGHFVATPSAAAVADLHRYRSALERGALEVALERGAGFTGVAAAVAALASLPPASPWVRVADAHHAIHAAIVATAGSERLDAAYGQLRAELLFMVTRIRPLYTIQRMVDVHRRLLHELESGDPDRCAAALARDLEDGREALAAGSDA